jgi:hypothetical protein
MTTTVMISQWDDVTPWLRFIMCFTNDQVKEEFLKRHMQPSREELDSRGTLFEPRDYRHSVADLFNDSEAVFTVPAMPEVHHDFSEDMECPLTVQPIDVAEVAKRLQNMKVLLNNMKIPWERSGSGSYMKLPNDDNNYQCENDVYQFFDGDDRKSFLSHAQNKVHILFWWDIAYKHQLLTSALEILDSNVGGDGVCVPSARKGSTKSKGSITVFQENHLSELGNMTQEMVAMVELKTLENLETKIKKVSSQIETKNEKLSTIADGMWETQLILFEKFQVEDFFSVCSGDGFAIKLYKSKLERMKQEQTGIQDALLDLEELEQKLVKDMEDKENEFTEYRRISNKRFAVTDGSVPTSVQKRRRGEGGISASISHTPSAMSDNFSYDGAIDN